MPSHILSRTWLPLYCQRHSLGTAYGLFTPSDAPGQGKRGTYFVRPQSRVKLKESVIDEFAEAMENKVQFPPITVFYDGIDDWLVDGFH